MVGLLIMGGLISGAFVSLPYILLMRGMSKWQFVSVFGVISVMVLALSTQISDNSPFSMDIFARGFWQVCFFALVLGWFVCGLCHLLFGLCFGWRSEKAQD